MKSFPLNRPISCPLIVTLGLLGIASSAHAALLATWDVWADTTTPYVADTTVTGFTATAATSTNRAINNFTSNDNTFGTVAGATTDSNARGVLLRASDNTFLTITLTNSTGFDYNINSIHFDYERRANSPDEVVLTYDSGGLGPAGTLNTWSGIALGSYSGGAADFTDYNFNLSPALSDIVLGNGESAVFTLTFNNGIGTSSGVLDNLAFQGAVVPEPSSAALLGLAGACLLFRRRRR